MKVQNQTLVPTSLLKPMLIQAAQDAQMKHTGIVITARQHLTMRAVSMGGVTSICDHCQPLRSGRKRVFCQYGPDGSPCTRNIRVLLIFPMPGRKTQLWLQHDAEIATRAVNVAQDFISTDPKDWLRELQHLCWHEFLHARNMQHWTSQEHKRFVTHMATHSVEEARVHEQTKELRERLTKPQAAYTMMRRWACAYARARSYRCL